MKKENEELKSRRDFFKKAAKSILPILSGITIVSFPFVSKAAKSAMGWGCSGCYTTCAYTCRGSCYNGCYTTCVIGCAHTCQGVCGGCRNDCTHTCTSCYGSCLKICTYGTQFG